MVVNHISKNIQKNCNYIKNRLPSEDILHFTFNTLDGVACAIFYADGMVNKELLGELVARPISALKLKNEGGMYETTFENIQKNTLFPESKEVKTFDEVIREVLDGNSALFIDGVSSVLIIGAKLLPVRAVMEPPTDIAVKGPREGFIEDIKTNMSLIRKRLKTPDLRFETLRVGKQSDTMVSICWL